MTRLGHKDQEPNDFSKSHHLRMLVRDFENHLAYVTQMHNLAYKGLEPTKISTRRIFGMIVIMHISFLK
jgi:hypothetical protein